MNKADLVDAVRSTTRLSRRQAEAAVETTFASVVRAVTSGQRVTLHGFGSFHPSDRAARTGRNPRTGETVKIAASKGVRFAPAASFKAALNPTTKSAAKKATPAPRADKTAKAAKAAKTTRTAKATRATKANKTTKKR